MNTPQPKQKIVVPREGFALLALLPALGLTFDRVNPLLGEELGSPRDYSMPTGSPTLVFTRTGVRNLVRLFDLQLEVCEEQLAITPVPAPSTPSPAETQASTDAHGRDRRPWYQREGEP